MLARNSLDLTLSQMKAILSQHLGTVERKDGEWTGAGMVSRDMPVLPRGTMVIMMAMGVSVVLLMVSSGGEESGNCSLILIFSPARLGWGN